MATENSEDQPLVPKAQEKDDTPDPARDKGITVDISLHEDYFRFLTYTFLILTMVSGQIITTRYNVPEKQGGGWTPDSKWEVVDLEDNAIYNVFGYNNVCVFFDTLPAKYVAVWLFELTMVFYVCYVISSHLAMHLEQKRNTGTYSYRDLILMRVTMGFDILAFTYAVEIFAVEPKENFVMHTLPFSALILGIIVCSVRNVLHDLKCMQYEKSSVRCIAAIGRPMEKVYGVLVVLASIWKLTVQYRGIVKSSPPAPEWGQLSDSVWLLLAVLIPWAKATITIIAPDVLPDCAQMLHIKIANVPYKEINLRHSTCPCCALQEHHRRQLEKLA